ncbi:hypothetical protein [Acetobacter syzygii]|uniref:hypothetical protein n=1 Tax=Acetobacter syzygii TaxID=146476 RepID=UPI0039EAB8E2
MADENDIALGVVKIAQANGGLCTFTQAYQQIPNYVKLSAANLAASTIRPGEPMWYQLVRNIKSHDTNPGNFIHDGYLIHVPDIGYKIP